ncbi:serine hydrolase domain-containing protein [Bradyrhizobium australiense]|uniref:Serine hydrolase n=1 Tax=Bradyrhizobium australiense TaxID=2721161 RepID=A0A7Y4GPZ3_9BRAD|nr:serine hydrolase [Bradyrhizobium australiense]NOJ39830.1 serine hydrolase [Bradyrhizobium australiense]
MNRHLSWFALPLALVVGASGVGQEAARVASEAALGPVFSDTGPEAEVYGAAAGFPVGDRASASQPGYLVGTYSHFGEMFPSRLVRRAATPWPFKRAAEPAISYHFRSERLSIENYLARNPTTGLLIARDDTILYEHYQYARTDQDRFLSQSMAKTITAMLIGIAVSEGKIKSIDDPVAAYVAGLSTTEYGKTSIRDLLHMSSGVTFKEIYDGNDDIAQLSRDLFGGSGKDPVASVAQFNTRVAPPGTTWHYASIETEILGLVLRAVTGGPVAGYLQDRIWQAIGAESDALWAIDGTGQEITFCCFNAVLRDYARFGRLLAHDGAWEGRQVIPRQWLLDATTVQPAAAYLAPGTATPYFGYGYQVWLLPGEARRFALLGIRGQIILVDPVSKLVMVHTAVRQKPSEPSSYAEVLALWFAVVAQLGK